MRKHGFQGPAAGRLFFETLISDDKLPKGFRQSLVELRYALWETFRGFTGSNTRRPSYAQRNNAADKFLAALEEADRTTYSPIAKEVAAKLVIMGSMLLIQERACIGGDLCSRDSRKTGVRCALAAQTGNHSRGV